MQSPDSPLYTQSFSPGSEADDERTSPGSEADGEHTSPGSEANGDQTSAELEAATQANEIAEEVVYYENVSLSSETDRLLPDSDETEADQSKLQRFNARNQTLLDDGSTVHFSNNSSRQFLRQKLQRYLRECYRRFKKFPAVSCFALLLMPGLIQVGCHYFFSRQVHRSIKYGDHQRHSIDLYLPINRDTRKPVVAFVTGGASITGYKAWGSILAQQLQERDIMVACIDYRNTPGTTISEMVEDASRGISFVCEHIIDEHGGDPNRIYVMGQQIGAYLAACAILHQATKEAEDRNFNDLSWRVSQIRHFFGLSGGYELVELTNVFKSRGLYDSLKLCVFEGERSATRFSPELLLDARHAVRILPSFSLFHGTGDRSISSASSASFLENLRSAGVNAELNLYDGRSDTDLFLLDPMRGGNIDALYRDLIGLIHIEDLAARAPPRRRLMPECMLKLARRFSPL